MATKRYVVREGFNFRLRDDKGNEKVYAEGDTVELEQAEGDCAHQLEAMGKAAKSANELPQG